MYEGCTRSPAMLPVWLIYNPHGERTCCAKHGDRDLTCPFYRTHTFGQFEVCAATSHRLDRGGDDGLGWLIPHVDCPLNHAIDATVPE